ncbi:MAG: stage III sporulation protein AD [Peptococcaceae bacterium]|nr:stage III sporulation protein AD [Peptococcaceae bacterium]
MDIVQIVGIALVVTSVGAILKQFRPEMAVQLTIVASVALFIVVMDKVKLVVDLLESLANQASISSFYLFIVLKIVGVAFIAELGSQICRDAGDGALAAKVDIAAKVSVIVLAMPIITAIIQSMMTLLGDVL